tara:strand:+ start:237 stop:1433 length:1197 start_codon:yes stop_codon:yes gene_type:complete
MLKNNYLLWVKIFFLLPFIISFLLIRIFIKIKIGIIESSIFGHMLTPIEIFLCEKKEKKLHNTDIVLWFSQKKITNKYILNKWKKRIVILPRHILEPLYIFFSFFEYSKKFNYFIKEKNPNGEIKILPGKKIDEFQLLQKYKPFIDFSNKEINQANKILDKFKLTENKKIVCFAGRSSHYKNELYETARNSDSNNYLLGMNYLAERDYFSFRVGKVSEKEIPNSFSKRIIDLTVFSQRSEFLDLYLISKSLFFVSCSSGINEMATIMRKQKILVDYIGFETLFQLNLFYIPIILPKKILSLKNNKFLDYSKILEFPLKEINNLNQLKEKNFKLVNNSPEEIKLAIINMHNYICGNLDINKEIQNQKNFWKKFDIKYGFQPNKTIICPSFYQNNISLFD